MRRSKAIAKAVLGGCEGVVIEDVGLETMIVPGARRGSAPEQVLVIDVRPSAGQAGRCPQCRQRCPGYDNGGGVRLWRTLDAGVTRTYLRAAAPRVRCSEHGVVVAHTPWARPKAKHTIVFEDACAWATKNMPITAVAAWMRVVWATVTAIVTRVIADRRGRLDLLDGLTRIGIDEIAYRKGHRYLMVIVDHSTGMLVWAREGRRKETLQAFFTDLGPQRAAELTHISCDGAEFIHTAAAENAPNAVVCLDPFHVIAWAMKALDKVRTRTAGRSKGAMWAVRKNPADLTGEQRTTLAALETDNRDLYRAYLLKEQLRQVFATKGQAGVQLLAGWISWASHSKLPEFVDLARRLRRYKTSIEATLQHGLSNGRVEATNTHLRALTKRAYGFHSPESLIAMAMLTRGGLCPDLPHQQLPHAA